MQKTVILLICAAASINAQYMTPYPTYTMGTGLSSGMGTGMGTHVYRPPGYMQTSQLSSMTYPTWRAHPLFRMPMANSEKTLGVNLPQDVMNVPKVPSAQEVLTHMALLNPNPKPLYDTISDFLYEPQKARHAVLAPVYVQGMNMMRANTQDDCLDGTNRGMSDWVY